MLTGSDELLAAAAEIASKYPDAAAILRWHAAPIENPDPRKLRRDVLRWIWREHYFGTTRSGGARLIAAAWHAWTDDKGEELPGTVEDAFARLDRAGMAPVSHRTIIDDLDESLD